MRDDGAYDEDEGNKKDFATIKDLTVHESLSNGIYGDCGMSFILENILIDNCVNHGIYSRFTRNNEMTNCEVSNSGGCGICVWGGLVIVRVLYSVVHHNDKSGEQSYYALHASTSSSLIKVVSPLTPETLSINNNGGRNYNFFYKVF